MQNMYETTKQCGAKLTSVVKQIIELRGNKTSENLPLLPTGLNSLVDRINNDEFTLVVSGEVNRGKSTFINAIIGRDILPTYDKETTSQVFKIRNSNHESFCVIYDNGDKQAITQEDLKKYGTEVDNDTINNNGKRILYIEVCTHIENLPSGVVIVDTPGIGSTYKKHTEIAKAFMQEADAVIYLCSPKHPIVKVDVDFIKNTILPIKTLPNVMFVMSKADLADSEQALEELIKRAEDQLVENFKEYASITKKVIPVDSLSLRDSNKNEGEVRDLFMKASNFEAVNNAINDLISRQRFFWIIGLYNLTVKYYKKITQYITKQIGDYDLSIENRQEKINSANQRLQRLEQELGTERQRATLTKISQIMHGFRHDLENIFTSSRSDLLNKYIKKVEDIPNNISSEDLPHEANMIFEELTDECASKWDEMCGSAINAIQNELNIYSRDCQLQVEEEYNLPSIDKDSFELDLDIKMSDRLDAMRNKFYQGGFVLLAGGVFVMPIVNSLFSTTIATLAASSWAGPIGWVVGGGGALVYGIIYGNRKAKEKAVIRAKADIKNQVKDILSETYSKLTRTSLMNGKYESLMNSFEKAVNERSTESISTIYLSAKKELENLKNSLMESQDSANRTKLINLQTLWNGKAEKLRELAPSIKQINESIL